MFADVRVKTTVVLMVNGNALTHPLYQFESTVKIELRVCVLPFIKGCSVYVHNVRRLF